MLIVMAPSGVIEASGLSFVGTDESQQPNPGTCTVCFDNVDSKENQSVLLPCRHTTCDDCWKGREIGTYII